MTWTKTSTFSADGTDAIFSFCSFNGTLYAGTYFSGTGGTGSNKYAQIWESTDGISWTRNATFPTLGGIDVGITGPSTAGLDGDRIQGMVVFGGKLIVLRVWAGQPRIYSWDGATWVLEKVLYTAYSLTYSRHLMTDGSKLYVCSNTSANILYSASTPSGTWTSEVNTTNLYSGTKIVAYGSDIFLSGYKSGADTYIYRKTGGSWNSGTICSDSNTIYDGCVFKNKLYFIGDSQANAGTKTNLYCWDGASWTTTLLSAAYPNGGTIFVSADNYLQTNAANTTPGGVATTNIYKSPDGVDFSSVEVVGTAATSANMEPKAHYNINRRSLMGYNGGAGAGTGEVLYSGQLVTADFIGTPTSGYKPLSVAFTDASTGASAWSWTFGDGNVSTNQNPSNIYSTVNVFDVALIAKGIDGDTGTYDTKTRLAYIESFNPVPAADFTASIAGINTIQFTDTSTESPTSWLWDFGDGDTSTSQNPIHLFVEGIYIVSLTATNAYGSDTETKTAYIIIQSTTLHNKVYVTNTSGKITDLNKYAVDFIQKELVVVLDSLFVDPNTEIKLTDAALINPDVSLGDIIGRCYSPTATHSILLRWRYPEGIDKSLFRHKIYRKKKGHTLQMKHSNGTFLGLREDPVAVKIYDEELTSGEFEDTYRLESGQQYFYTSFLEDKSTGFAYADALTLNPVSKVSVINRSEKWTADDVLALLPHQWRTKDTYGTNRAICDVLAFRNDFLRDIVEHIKLYDADKTLGEIVDLFASQWSGLPAQNKLGIDTLRRQIGMSQQATQWKGSRRGLIKFIRWLTTWEIGTTNIYTVADVAQQNWFETYGPGYNGSIIWDDAYGYGTYPYPLYGPTDLDTLGTTAEEIVFIEIPRVAIALGTSDALAYSDVYTSTILEDNKVSFSSTNPIGSYLIPNQNNPREKFEVLTYTPHKLYVRERVSTAKTGDGYAVLTPLDTQRLETLLDTIPFMLLFNVRPIIRFIL